MANPDNTPTPDTLQEALLNDPEFLQPGLAGVVRGCVGDGPDL